MKTTLILITIIALLAGCATTHEGTMTIPPGVRHKSTADDKLFHDVLTASGGVGFADSVLYPHAAQKVLINIEVITPYDNHHTGVERWTIQHELDSCSYLVWLIPDGRGGTTFTVQRDKNP